MAVSDRMSPAGSTCSHQLGSPRRGQSQHPAQQHYGQMLQLPLSPSSSHIAWQEQPFIGAKPQGKVPPLFCPTEHSLERTDTKSLVHHTALAPLPAGPKISPWDTELTCCSKRVLKTELQSQDAEQQAWNGVGMTESSTPAICFTHSPESLPSSTGSSSLKQVSGDTPPPSQSPR